jgi:MFS family permease
MTTTGTSTKPRLALVVVTLAVASIMGSQSALLIALAAITRSLHTSKIDLQWILDIYPVVLAALLLPFGALGDRYGRRRLLRLGLLVFSLANVGIALVPTSGEVIVLRAVAAAGAAMAFPATLATITSTFPAEERSRGIAVWGAGAIIGGFGGVLVSGLTLEVTSWRAVPAMIALTGALSLAGTFTGLGESAANDNGPLDVLGAALSTAAIGSIVYAIIESPTHDLISLRIGGVFFLGVALTTAFVRHQLRTQHPLIDLGALTAPSTGIGLVGLTSSFLGTYGAVTLIVQYFAFVRGMSALQSGVAQMLIGVLLVPASIVGPLLARRWSRGLVIAGGLVIAATGLAFFASITVTSSLTPFGIGAIVLGAGLGLCGTPATEAVVESLPAEAQGLASALNDITRELGAAISIAIAGAVLNGASSGPTKAGFIVGMRASCLTIGGLMLIGATGVLALQRKVTSS